jgi:hypothetical protein
MKVADLVAGFFEVKPRRSCNRHDDCDAADAALVAKREQAVRDAARDPSPYLPAWRGADHLPHHVDHCHDDGCSDCFGD